MRFGAALVFGLCLAVMARAEKVVLVAGGSGPDGSPAKEAKLVVPFGIDQGRNGYLYIAEFGGQRVRAIDGKGHLITVAGSGEKGHSGDGGPPLKATFHSMHNIVVAPNGDIYVSDTFNNTVRKLDGKTYVVTTVAGTGEQGFSGDGGPAVKAQFNGTFCVALDARGEKLYVADLGNRRIRALDLATGIVTTVAGNGEKGVPRDGAEAKSAPLVDPRAVALDRRGNLYILERSGHALRVVDPSGKIRTVAGTGKPGNTGDGGPALKATLKGPKHLWIDRDDSVLIADTDNHVIRRYTPADGRIIRVAGTGKVGAGGVGGPPDEVSLNQPHGVWVSPAGEIHIVDSMNNRVLKIVK
jgi:DNA-binding beta-propeller fold protein YncE